MKTLKQQVNDSLESNDLASIASFAKKDRKVISQLVRIAYDKETLAGRRAIKAIGLAARELLNADPRFLRETIRKLLWSVSDESGGIGWSAPEILGEIVSADPGRFHDVIPLIADIYNIEEKVFRPGVMYALARIGQTTPSLILVHKHLIMCALSDENPLVRIYAIEAVRAIKSGLSNDDAGVIARLSEKLLSDPAEVWIYRDTDFVNLQVKEAAQEAQLSQVG